MQVLLITFFMKEKLNIYYISPQKRSGVADE